MTTTFAAGTTGAERYNGRMTPKEGELPRDWSPLLQELHSALVAHMEDRGVSQNAIAAATGISQSGLSKFLKRTRGLAWNTAATLAEYLGMSIQLVRPSTPKKRTK